MTDTTCAEHPNGFDEGCETCKAIRRTKWGDEIEPDDIQVGGVVRVQVSHTPPYYVEGVVTQYGSTEEKMVGNLILTAYAGSRWHLHLDKVEFYIPPAFPEPTEHLAAVEAGEKKFILLRHFEYDNSPWYDLLSTAWRSWPEIVNFGPPRPWDLRSEMPKVDLSVPSDELPKWNGLPLAAEGIITVNQGGGNDLYQVRGRLNNFRYGALVLASSAIQVTGSSGELMGNLDIEAYEPPAFFEPKEELAGVKAGDRRYLRLKRSSDDYRFNCWFSITSRRWARWGQVVDVGTPEVWDYRDDIPVLAQP